MAKDIFPSLPPKTEEKDPVPDSEGIDSMCQASPLLDFMTRQEAGLLSAIILVPRVAV